MNLPLKAFGLLSRVRLKPSVQNVESLFCHQARLCTPRGTVKQIMKRSVHQIATGNIADPTIYALSTGSGKAAIAVIRISGPACRQVYQGLCPSTAFPKPRYATVRKLYNPHLSPSPATLLESGAIVLYFPGPNTVTGEDVLELHIHGGPAIVRAVLAAIPQSARVPTNGQETSSPQIRYAEPGEFTRRAFDNGRMDLPQIESLGELLSATTEQQRQISVRGMTSSLAGRYEDWRSLLLLARGELEALIDFSEDQHFDESPAALCASVARQVQEIQLQIHAHISNANRGELLRNGIKIALLGAPNAGKSSLLNRIVGREAAIVSSEAGTTRDIVEVGLDLGGWLVKIGDMAGLRKGTAMGEGSVGAIEEEGIRRAKRRAVESDVVIVVQDVTTAMNSEVAETVQECLHLDIEVLFVLNKVDQLENFIHLRNKWLRKIESDLTIPHDQIFFISCKEEPFLSTSGMRADGSRGIKDFVQGMISTFTRITAAITPDNDPNPAYWQESLGTTERQRVLLGQCRLHLNEFLDTVRVPDIERFGDSGIEVDGSQDVDIVVAAECLRSAANALSKVTGRGDDGDVDEVLGVVFEKFCVGK